MKTITIKIPFLSKKVVTGFIYFDLKEEKKNNKRELTKIERKRAIDNQFIVFKQDYIKEMEKQGYL